MAEIPRFQAQIQSLQVPSMKNYQEQQNASITQSLAQFGSELMTGVINAKEEKSSRFPELLQEGKELSNEDIKKKNDAILHESFDTSFYNDALTNLGNIALQNKNNPAAIEEQSSAYIDGLISEIPEKQQEQVAKSLNFIKDSYSKQSLEQFNEEKLHAAKQEIINNLYVSQDIASTAMQAGAPEDVQMASYMNYINNIRAARKNGEISETEEIRLIESFQNDLVVNHLGDVLRDKSIPEKQKSIELKKFMDGKTGNDVVDKMMSATDRTRAVLEALNAQRQIDAFEENHEKELKELKENSFKETLANFKKQKLLGNLSIDQEQEMLAALYRDADPEYYDEIANIESGILPKATPILGLKIMSKAKSDGSWGEEVLNRLLDANLISEADAKKELEELGNIYNVNKKFADPIISEAKSVLKYTEQTPFAFNDFMARFSTRISENPMTREQVLSAGREALQETLKERTNTKLVKEVEKKEFVVKNGIEYKDAMSKHAAALYKVTERLKKEGKSPTFEDVKPELRNELKKFIEQKRNLGTQLDVYNSQGVKYTDDLLLDVQIEAIKAITEDDY